MDVTALVEPDRVHKTVYTDQQIFDPRWSSIWESDLGLLRPRVAGAQPRRLPRGDDRPPADDHGAPGRRQRAGALQPLPAPRRAGRRQPQGQHRQRLRLLVPRVELPPRRQRARDPARQGLRGNAHDARQPRLRHEARGARRELPRLRVREPRRRRTVAHRVPRRRQDRVRRHVRPLAARRGRGRADLPSRHAALELEVLHGEPARRAPSFGDAPVDRHLRRHGREAPQGRERRGAALLPLPLDLRVELRAVGRRADDQLPARPRHPEGLHGAAPARSRHARVRGAAEGRVRRGEDGGVPLAQHPPRPRLSLPLGAVAAAAAALPAPGRRPTRRCRRSGTSA